MTSADAPRPRPKRTASEELLLTHALLVGLTPLIPIPLLDDLVKGVIERGLARRIAAAHGKTLSDEQVEALTDEGGSLLWSIAKGVATFPFKLVFRKLFIVLEVKRASDEASRCYHRGYLLDVALGAGLLAPEGPRSPAELRKAVEAACDEVKVSPVGKAFSAALERSKGLFQDLGRSLLDRIAKRGGSKPDVDAVEGAVEDELRSDPAVGGLVERLRAAMKTVPGAHFVALEDRFETLVRAPLARPSGPE
jgi:hypothetical protein